MNAQKMMGILGLAMKARQVSSGTDACRMLIRSGKCGIVLADVKTASNTRKKISGLCQKNGIPIRILPNGMIEEATGRTNMVLGICKSGFSEQIIRLLQEDQAQQGSHNEVNDS